MNVPLTLTISIKLHYESQLQEQLFTWDTQQVHINSILICSVYVLERKINETKF